MHPAIIEVSEPARGCGFRKVGGLYLRADGGLVKCGKLPILIPAYCPTCGEGIRPSRAPRMHQNIAAFWTGKECREVGGQLCSICPFNLSDIGPALLLWIGEKFYPTPSSFAAETRVMGISRRITAVPKDFIIGQTWVVMAHPSAVLVQQTGDWLPAIIGIVLPDRIEVVVDHTTDDETVEKYIKRGLTPVIVDRLGAGDVEEDD